MFHPICFPKSFKIINTSHKSRNTTCGEHGAITVPHDVPST